MGYVTAMGRCAACERVFSFNPLRVPSIRKETGQREPVCEDCMAQLNVLRESRGLKPIKVAVDAYTECDERELPDDD